MRPKFYFRIYFLPEVFLRMAFSSQNIILKIVVGHSAQEAQNQFLLFSIVGVLNRLGASP
jgi:hypothetical protein